MSAPSSSEIDWSTAKSIADEPTIRRFIQSLGGVLIDQRHPNPEFENADFLFEDARVLVELKVLETEFGKTDQFQKKLLALGMKVALKFGLGPFLRQDGKAGEAYQRGLLELFRPPLARITKKASRQINATKTALNMPHHKGIMWCVNDNFRELRPTTILGLLGRILQGSGSGIDGFVYLTNHHVELPGDPYANILWVPFYRDSEDVALSEFVNWLGRKWFDFCELETGPSDHRIEGDDIGIAGARVITSQYREYRYDPPSRPMTQT